MASEKRNDDAITNLREWESNDAIGRNWQERGDKCKIQQLAWIWCKHNTSNWCDDDEGTVTSNWADDDAVAMASNWQGDGAMVHNWQA